MAAFVCAIISGVWTNPTSNNINTGYSLRRAAEFLFLFCVLCILGLTVLLFSSSKTKEQRNDLVLVQVLIVSPILLIRIIYATVQSFLSTPTSPGRNTWVYLGLLLIPDFVSVTIYTVFGFKIKPLQRAGEWPASYTANGDEFPQETNQPATFDGPTGSYQDVEGKSQPAVTPQPSRRRRQRRIRGPIHMLIDAIRGE